MVAIHPTRHTVRVPMEVRHTIRARLSARVLKVAQVLPPAHCIHHQQSPKRLLKLIHWATGH